MTDDIKLPEPDRWLSPGGMYAATRTVMPPAKWDVAMYTADQLRAAVLADRAERHTYIAGSDDEESGNG